MGILSLCRCETPKMIGRRFRERERASRPQQSSVKFVKKEIISHIVKNYW